MEKKKKGKTKKKREQKGPSYRVAKNLFPEIKNQDQKPINAKIYFFSLIGHVGTRAIFFKINNFL